VLVMRRPGSEDYAVPRDFRQQFEGLGYRMSGELSHEFAEATRPVPVSALRALAVVEEMKSTAIKTANAIKKKRTKRKSKK